MWFDCVVLQSNFVIVEEPRAAMRFTKMTNKMQLCRIIYCSLIALHVLSDTFAHHQELNCIYSFWFIRLMLLPAGVMEELEVGSFNSSMTPVGNDISE
jgi:hypothetical protein